MVLRSCASAVNIGLSSVLALALTASGSYASPQRSPDARLASATSSLALLEDRVAGLEREVSLSVEPERANASILEKTQQIRKMLQGALLPLRGVHFTQMKPVLEQVQRLEARLHAIEEHARGSGQSSGFSLAQQLTPQPANAPQGTGAISGIVTDALTGLPLAGVTVTVWGGPSPGSAETDASGAFTITGLSAGTYKAYTVGVPAGYIPEVFNNVWCKWYCDYWLGTSIAVAEGVVTSGINFALERYGRISGMVRDASNGSPVEGAVVRVYDGLGYFYQQALTDVTGAYTADQLIPGSYFLVAESEAHVDQLYQGLPCEDYQCNPTAGTAVLVSSGGSAQADFLLTPSGSVSGYLTDNGTGQPVEATVYVYAATGMLAKTVYAYGAYSAQDLPPGQYFLLAQATGYAPMIYQNIVCQSQCDPLSGNPVTVTSGSNTPGISFALLRLGKITGLVTDEVTGFPIDSATIRIWKEDGSLVDVEYTWSAGYYSSVGLWPGNYFVTVSHSTYLDELYDDLPCQPLCDPTSGTPVPVSFDADTTNVNFSLRLGGGVSGLVTAAADGLPLGNIVVEVFDSTGTLVGSSTTVASGYYVVRDLPAGTYFARARDGFYLKRYLGQLYQGIPCDPSCTVTGGTPIPVSLGQATAGVNFSLDRLGIITGQVLAFASGTPITYADVRVYDSNGALVTWVETDSLGRYTVYGLSPATYFVVASATTLVSQLYAGIDCLTSCNVTSGTPISLGLNAVASGVDFSLHRLGRITGSVLDFSTGQALSGAWVRLYDATGTYVGARQIFSGTFAFDVPPGTYYAVADHANGFVTELYSNRDCYPTCNVTQGSPLVVNFDQVVGGVNFLLRKPFFADVPLDHWARRWIETMYTHGITAGCQNNPSLFCPLATTNRRQVAVWIAKAHSGGVVPANGTVPGMGPYDCSPGGTSVFADILPEEPACRFIHYLAAQGIATGCGGGLFCPGDPVKRWQMAVFTAKAIAAGPVPVSGTVPGMGDYDCSPGGISVFADVAPTDPGCRYIHYLAGQNIVSGCGGGNFCPNMTLRRDQGSVVTAKAFGLYRYRP